MNTGEGDLWPSPLFSGVGMADYQKFRSAFNAGSSDPQTQKIDRIAKQALGMSAPDDEEEKKRRNKAAIERRASFYSDTTGEG